MEAGRYKPYQAYKASGVEWLRDIPEGWRITRLKYVSECLDGARIPLNASQRGEMSGPYPYWGANSVVGYIDNYIFDEELILLGEDGAPFFDPSKDVAFHVRGKIWPNNHVHILRANKAKVDASYLTYCLNVTEYYRYITGSTRDKLNQSDMNEIALRHPTLPEQTQIAAFLDYETAQIDALIAKQQRLIALLEEKRQAVISHAVTKGLDPAAPLRPSGIDWLGDVPAHWEVKRLGALFSESNSRAETVEELKSPILSVSIHHGISDKELDDEELDRKISRSSDRSLYKVIHRNDLAYNMMRAWQGGFGASRLDGLVSPAYVVCNPQTLLPSRYFELVLRTPNAVTELKRFSRGITDFRLRLYWDEFKNICVPVPSPDEISAILGDIGKKMLKHDGLKTKAQAAIALLKERRTALISAAVTGKIDVRDWQPPHSVSDQDILQDA